MDGIFISYRRDDSAGYAGRLYDRLVAHFGAERVFMDVEGIEPGLDFVVAIEEAVASCRVLIAVIGDEWTAATDAAGRRRLDDPNDFIRLETGAALKRGIRVVPVLVGDAVMPLATDLPDDLKALTRRQAIEINHKQWDASTGELIHTLEGILKVPLTDAQPKEKLSDGRAVSSAPPVAKTSDTPDDVGRGGNGGKRWVVPVAALAALLAGVGLWLGQGEKKSATVPETPVVAKALEPSAAKPPRSISKPERATAVEERPPAGPAVATSVPPPAAQPAPAVRAEGRSATAIPAPTVPAPQVREPKASKTLAMAPKVAVSAVKPEVPASMVVPPAGPDHAATAFPVKGERWIYRASGKWPTSFRQRFEIVVQSNADSLVTDELRVAEGAGGPEVRQSRGSKPDFVSWNVIGTEFSPYLGAYVDLDRQGSLGSLATPDLDPQWRGWSSKADVVGRESVSVPAGTFDAFKIQVWSNRRQTGSAATVQVEPVRINYIVWYAPQVKRYVRMKRTVMSANNSEIDADLFELVAHRVP